jgi:hypothetical protein
MTNVSEQTIQTPPCVPLPAFSRNELRNNLRNFYGFRKYTIKYLPVGCAMNAVRVGLRASGEQLEGQPITRTAKDSVE